MELTEKGWGIIHHAGDYLQPGDYVARNAIECFEQALALDSSNVMALAGLAYRYQANVNPQTAKDEDKVFVKNLIKKALDIDPELSAAYVALGRYYTAFDRDLKAAKEAFEKAINLDSQNADAYRSYSNLMLWRIGDFDKALELAKKAVEIDPSHTPAKHTLAQAYRYLGRYDEGLEWAEKAFDDFKHMSYFQEKAINLFLIGQSDSAKEILEQGLLLYPEPESVALKNIVL